jgi:hypothetical protein
MTKDGLRWGAIMVVATAIALWRIGVVLTAGCLVILLLLDWRERRKCSTSRSLAHNDPR